MTKNTEIQTSAGKRIEHLKLKEVNGFARLWRILAKALIIILISSLAGGLAGYAVQKGFRDMTGYNRSEPAAAEEQADEKVETGEENNKGILARIADAAAELSESVRQSELVQKTSDAVTGSVKDLLKPVTDLLNGLLNALDKAAFWIPFILVFMITAWSVNRMVAIKNSLTHGADPQVAKNMKMLEAKVNELIDHANR